MKTKMNATHRRHTLLGILAIALGIAVSVIYPETRFAGGFFAGCGYLAILRVQQEIKEAKKPKLAQQ